MQAHNEIQGVEILRLRKDSFIFYKNKNKIKSDLEKKEQFENGLPRDGIYKFHISISNDEYPKVKKIIVKLLINAIADGAINSFKHTDEKYLKFANDHPFRHTQESILRFLNGDQFTIYIPNKYDLNKLVTLCNDINVQLRNIEAGNITKFVSIITPHIGIRQEYFKVNEKYYYISISPESKEERLLLKNAKKAMSEHELYIVLKNSLNQEHTTDDITYKDFENINVKIIENPNSMDSLLCAKFFNLLLTLKQFDCASGLCGIIEILNENSDNFIKLKEIANFANYKKSDSNFTYRFHKYIRGRSELVENVYRIISTFNLKDPDNSLASINKQLIKLIQLIPKETIMPPFGSPYNQKL